MYYVLTTRDKNRFFQFSEGRDFIYSSQFNLQYAKLYTEEEKKALSEPGSETRNLMDAAQVVFQKVTLTF